MSFADHWQRIAHASPGVFSEGNRRLAQLFYYKGIGDAHQAALDDLGERIKSAQAAEVNEAIASTTTEAGR